MENNGGQSASFAGSSRVQTPSASKSAKKISGLAVVLMIVFLAVGFGGGAVVGGLMAGGTGTADEDGGAIVDKTPTASTSVDTTMQDELDKKIDAYQASKPWGMGIRPFHESYLSAQDKLYTVFNYMKNDQLKGLVDAMNNSAYPYETTISIDVVKDTYEAFFGEILDESDMVSFSYCGFDGGVTGTFEYDSANDQYKASLPENPGCGGTSNSSRFAYRDSYSIEGDKAYVTVEVGSASSAEFEAGVYSDYLGGTKVQDLVDGALSTNYINESNKDSFTKYQYVFEKQDSGDWALKGLYPTKK